MRNPYSVLGVARSADQEHIRKAYKDLAKRYHPDRNQDNEKAADRFKEVNAAYDVLKDPDRRAMFDEFGEVSLKPGFDAASVRFLAAAGSAADSAGAPLRVGGDPLDLAAACVALGGTWRSRSAWTSLRFFAGTRSMSAMHALCTMVMGRWDGPSSD